MKSIFVLIFLAWVLPTSFTLTDGAVDNFSTDKSVYHKNDQLNISGNVQYDPDIPSVTVQIFTPGKSGFADFNMFPVSSDGGFSATFHVGGPTWSTDGNYPIIVTYDGNLEKTIQYQEFSDELPSPEPKVPTEQSPEPKVPTEQSPEPVSILISTDTPNFITLKFKIPNFPALDKSPQYYIDRYNNEQSYKNWFDSQFPNDSISDVVGYNQTNVSGFPSVDKSPQYYIDRYNNEQSYKNWFDSQFPNDSMYHILGYKNPVSVPDWIRNNAEWWAIGEINDSTFVSGIEFMLENNIIRVSNISPSGNISEDEIPSWIRNNAHWWSQDLISEDEFINSLKFLIQQGVITIN